eukprot:CAMPEP_0181316340 /NCGR_PEP_ID=MMETSP1101-20121128/15841_1 /TAXON_ID=46948 /ORGANISM="Rhodomonas abbreviata, Strain Caron Lab Isolate" /LENGTH=282 /DNA_ID=CAMNT_0023423577 /DNA_START=60 /DNA_END=908 /DNA_ORIENTATION=+
MSASMVCGKWPCKMNIDDGDGLEMVSTAPVPVKGPDSGPSPTCSTASSEGWTGPMTKIDSAAAAIIGSMTQMVGSQTPESLSTSKVQPWSPGMQHGGGVFASIRGAHSSWQVQKDSEAANVRHKATISLALAKARTAPAGGPSDQFKDTPRRERSAAVDDRAKKIDANSTIAAGADICSPSDAWSTKSLIASITKSSAAEALPALRASAFALMSKRSSQQDAKRKDTAMRNSDVDRHCPPSGEAYPTVALPSNSEDLVEVEWQARNEEGIRLRSCVTCIGQY